MKLNADLASKIVKEARSSINEHFIIVDTECKIIASSESERIGEFHEGALQAIQENRIVNIYPEDRHKLQGVKPGINTPIKYQDEIIGVIGITGDPLHVRPYADIIRRLTELFIREAIQAEQLASRNRGLEAFIYEWIHRKTVDEAFKQRGDILGIPLSGAYGLVLCRLHSREENGKSLSVDEARVDEYIQACFHQAFNIKEDVMIHWGKEGYLLLINEQNFKRHTIGELFHNWCSEVKGMGARLAIGVAQHTYEEIVSEGFREAEKALNACTVERPVMFYEQLRLEILLQDIPDETCQAFFNVTLKRLENSPELIQTIEAYFAQNMSIASAAEALHLHVNTLHYRLNKIAEMTELDVKTTEGIVLAYLALRLRQES
ncbi:carbohydrate diacid regulator [Pullulanibacillus camelliae]|uniref:Carbohydrate diacid regulator n=1 Tax=Pullulanibacillus camelliae TaxID=1707096 RepID=A0A8J2YKU9_9BACL|nr:sugar diacid recognition domain-containing protein [Pullulanibacillus camelliae]GGE49539.1 carbohydrate diacid regulator [Pullulanibacillus camelliae]